MKTKTIYVYVLLGTLMMLFLGIVYSYSIFRVEIESIYQVSSFLSGLPFMFVLFFYAFGMAITGVLMEKYSIKLLLFIGVILIGGGFILASLSNSIVTITITYGILIGSGIGMLYGMPLRVVSQLDHPRPGFLTGITLMGFGLSPLLFAPILGRVLQAIGLHRTFLILGILYSIVLSIVGVLLTNNQSIPEKGIRVSFRILKQPSFYRIYSLFFIGTFVGLSIIGFTATIGVDILHLNLLFVTTLLALFSIFNGVGRPLFGYLNDRYGFTKSGTISYITMIIASILFYVFSHSIVIYIVSFIVFYINFGGWLSLAPSATIQAFGKKQYSQNYGFMFTAYGLGAMIGNGVSGTLVDSLGYHSYFLLLVIISIVGLIIIQTTKQKKNTI